MDKKKLKPTLPKDEKEIFEKGFEGNIAGGKKFVTDGHSMFLAEAAPDGMLFRAAEDYGGKPVKNASIQAVWNKAEKRKHVAAHFIGCGVIRTRLDESDVVAVVRDEQGRCAMFNPWILAFVLMCSRADSFAFSSGHQYCFDMMALLREGKVVGAIMPLRYSEQDLTAYDLTGPAVELK